MRLCECVVGSVVVVIVVVRVRVVIVILLLSHVLVVANQGFVVVAYCNGCARVVGPGVKSRKKAKSD